MGRILAIAVTAAVFCGSVPAFADPCVDVGISFEPAVTVPGDGVTLSAFINNTGDEAGLIDLAITVEFNKEVFGPVEGQIHLGDGDGIGLQLMLLVPSRLAPGTLSITLDAAAGECEDSATATLTIEEGEDTGADSPDLTEIGTQLLLGLIRGTTPTLDTTWGSLKHRYRSPSAMQP